MRRAASRLGVLILVAGWPLAVGATDLRATPASFTETEVRRILQHGPWPPPSSRDPSNRVSGMAAGIELGERLFFDTRLSAAGAVACATCHVPQRSWTDGQSRGVGLGTGDRNTLGLANVRRQRWFGWDGAGDSLWAQSIRPILDPTEMSGTAGQVAALVRSDRALACQYQKAFGGPPPMDDDAVLVDVAKALAAFQETLSSGRTAFDEFRDALARADAAAAARYPLAAQRGLKIFVGKGACGVCHVGPNFTNGEFDDIGIPYFVGPGRVDPGRYEGIKRVKASRLNLLGRYNDDPTRSTATGTRHVSLEHRQWGAFKVPSLRNVALTAPYMHSGALPTLRAVVQHYSELDEERLHADGVRVLQPLRLTPAEVDDLVAFLDTLSDPGPAYRGPAAPAESTCLSQVWAK
ncbi:MAG: cytochrome-c peroxidase [Candidatus Rokuibacteriota bacterium]